MLGAALDNVGLGGQPVTGSPPPLPQDKGDGQPADPVVALLLDRAQIHDVNARYALAVDRRDWSLLESCFRPDVEVTDWGLPGSAGRTELLEFIKGVAHFHTTMHMMGNQFIAVDGDKATLNCYAMLTHHYEREGQAAELNVSGSRYIEGLVRQDGGWIISQRGGDPTWATTPVARPAGGDKTVQALTDRAQIHDLLMGYALGIDRHDYDQVRECFADSFTARYGERSFSDLDSLVQFVSGVELFDSTTHFLSRPWVEVRDDEAFALTYAMISHRPPTPASETSDSGTGRIPAGLVPGEWMTAGPIYRDRLVRQDGRWRIAERGGTIPVAGSGSPSAPSAAPADLAGGRPADPMVAWLADRELIRHTTTRWNLALDLHDADAARACLAPEASVSLEPAGPGFAGPSTIVSQLRSVWDGQARTCHWPGNQLVDIHGDEARVETYTYLSRQEPGGHVFVGWPTGARRYVDRMVRRDGGWLIAERRLETNRVA